MLWAFTFGAFGAEERKLKGKNPVFSTSRLWRGRKSPAEESRPRMLIDKRNKLSIGSTRQGGAKEAPK
jgi:hypothetical protein